MKLYRTLTVLIFIIVLGSLLTPIIKNKQAEIRGYHYKDKVLVLLYHHIAENTNDATITPQQFEEQMKILKDKKFNVIGMDQFINFLEKKGSVPENAVLITFDDGYESFYTKASPILEKYNFVATNFVVVSSTVLKNTPIPHLTWDEMRALKEKGMTFYSHTYNAHQMTTNAKGENEYILLKQIINPATGQLETQAQYEKRVEDDLKLADKYLQDELGNKDKILCFPYGVYNDTVINIGKKVGIRYFFTVKEGVNKPGMTEIFRINVGSSSITTDVFYNKLKMFNE